MNKESLEEKYYKIKYFYHIDIDKLCTKLKEKKNIKSDITAFFVNIFEEVVTGSQLYSQYLLSDSALPFLSFFNFTSKDESVCSVHQTLVNLCRISLFHHCVLNGLETLLISSKLEYPNISKTYSTNGNIFLCGATDYDIQRGLFAAQYLKEKRTIPKEQTIYQNYNSIYYKRYHNNPDGFSHTLLSNTLLKEKASKKTSSGQLSVPTYQSNPLLFLFKNSNVRCLDKSLSNPKTTKRTLINTYKGICSDAESWKMDMLKNNCDSILFDTTLEPYYHFNFLKDAEYFFQDLDENSPYYLLSGKAFLNIIQDFLMSLPITYNRFIFLEYACHAAIYSHNLNEASYPPIPDSALGQRLSAYIQADDQHIITALRQIGNFLRMLKYCTLPILEDLWDILTSEKYGIALTLSTYLHFFDQNYTFMTADYYYFSKKNLDFNYIWKNQLSPAKYNFYTSYQALSFNVDNMNVQEQEQQKRKKRKTYNDSFYSLVRNISNPSLTEHKGIDNIILSQSSEYNNKTAYSTEYDLFNKQHLNIIFDFTRKISSDVIK